MSFKQCNKPEMNRMSGLKDMDQSLSVFLSLQICYYKHKSSKEIYQIHIKCFQLFIFTEYDNTFNYCGGPVMKNQLGYDKLKTFVCK